MNGLMMVDIQDRLDGRHLGLMRSAGTVGARAFDELVNRHWKPFYQVLPDEIAALCDCSFAPLCECSEEGFNSYGVDVLAFKHKRMSAVRFGDNRLYEEDDKGGIALCYSALSHLTSARSLTISSSECLVSLPNEFMRKASGIEELSFTEVTRISTTPSHFMGRCINLQGIDLKPLANVTRIQHRFLEGCKALKEIDLTPMTQIASIGDCFLKECSSLKHIDLAPLSRVTCVGQWFLSDCKSLEKVDLTPISNITAMKWGFLMSCTKLRELDLTPLSKVKRIGSFVLAECANLKLDFTPLTEVYFVGHQFAKGRNMTVVFAPLLEAIKRNNVPMEGVTEKERAQYYEESVTNIRGCTK